MWCSKLLIALPCVWCQTTVVFCIGRTLHGDHGDDGCDDDDDGVFMLMTMIFKKMMVRVMIEIIVMFMLMMCELSCCGYT